MDTPAPQALFDAVTRCLAEHDLEGVMAHGAPLDEYAPEARDFAWMMASGEPVTAEAVARVWAKWFGDGSPAEPTRAMEVLAADLQALPGQLVG
ncbi:hypothetical protein [Sinomonas atrocyanea]